jgi:hypothetical protein
VLAWEYAQGGDNYLQVAASQARARGDVVTNRKRKDRDALCTTEPYNPWQEGGREPLNEKGEEIVGAVVDPFIPFRIGNFPDDLPRISEIRSRS